MFHLIDKEYKNSLDSFREHRYTEVHKIREKKTPSTNKIYFY